MISPESRVPKNHASRPIKAQLDEIKAFITARIPEPELQTVTANLSARGLGGFVQADLGVHRMRRGGTRSEDPPRGVGIVPRVVPSHQPGRS